MIIPALIAGGAALAGGALNNASNAKQAKRNRDFQERMSNTAHQREVADLRAANINPALRSLSGADTPAGDRAEMEDAVGKGINAALAVRRQKAEIDLLRAQAAKAGDEALFTRAQTGVIDKQWNAGLFDKLQNEVELSRLSVEERRQMVPLVIQRAQAEIEQIGSNVRATKARAMLDEAAHTGALNIEEFERMVGSSGTWVKYLVNLFRSLRR